MQMHCLTFALSIRQNDKNDNSVKKVMIALMMVVATSTASFAKAGNHFIQPFRNSSFL